MISPALYVKIPKLSHMVLKLEQQNKRFQKKIQIKQGVI